MKFGEDLVKVMHRVKVMHPLMGIRRETKNSVGEAMLLLQSFQFDQMSMYVAHEETESCLCVHV